MLLSLFLLLWYRALLELCVRLIRSSPHLSHSSTGFKRQLNTQTARSMIFPNDRITTYQQCVTVVFRREGRLWRESAALSQVGVQQHSPGSMCSWFSPKTHFGPENHGYTCACQNIYVCWWSGEITVINSLMNTKSTTILYKKLPYKSLKLNHWSPETELFLFSPTPKRKCM